MRASLQSETGTAFTTLPSNGPKPQPASRSVTSFTRRSMRRSGLSEPNSSIACLYGMRVNGAEDATLYVPYFAKIGGSTSSRTAKTSSCVANAISMSSW